jgi:restriction system protein
MAYFKKHKFFLSVVLMRIIKYLTSCLLRYFQLHPAGRRHRKKRREAKQFLGHIRAQPPQPALLFGKLRHLDPFVFEELLLLCFKKLDYKVKLNTRYTGDGGIDGIVFDAQGRKILLQAKRYSQAINPQHVHDFHETIEKHAAAFGYFIHTGRTGRSAYQSRQSKVQIISGEKLVCFVLGRPFSK